MKPSKILIVDDDREFLQTLKDAFLSHEKDIKLFLAGSVKEALKILKKEDIDLVISDLRMEGMDGLDLLNFVRKKMPHVPFILITAYGSPAIEIKAEKMGAVKYMTKPIILEELEKAVMELLNRERSPKEQLTFNSPIHLAQLVKFEGKDCALKIISPDGRKGVLEFENGKLINARLGKLEGEEAAVEILSWKDVLITVEKGSGKKKVTIDTPLEDLIVKALKKKEEPPTPQEIPEVAVPEEELIGGETVDEEALDEDVFPSDEGEVSLKGEFEYLEEYLGKIDEPESEEEEVLDEEGTAGGKLARSNIIETIQEIPGYLAMAIFTDKAKLLDFHSREGEPFLKEIFQKTAALSILLRDLHSKYGKQDINFITIENENGFFYAKFVKGKVLILRTNKETKTALIREIFSELTEELL